MNATEMLQRIGETLGSTATVKSVFGEPIHAAGKTVVPIAKVAYGFGAGGGAGPDKKGEGGGGGVRAFPAGALEITETTTRFIPFANVSWLAGAFAAGAALGLFMFRHNGRH